MVRQHRPSMTARWVAAQRSRLHHQRPSTATGDAAAELRLYRGFSRGLLLPGLRPTGMVLRTQFVDAEVVRAIDTGVTQAVLVGAGYDGRALRFRQPNVHWFEVDHPATQPDKQRRMRAAAGVMPDISFAPVDLLHDDVGSALREAGHDATRTSLFICEGLFTYLPNSDVSTLCSRLHDLAAPGSVLVASTLVVRSARGGKAQVIADSILRLLGERRLGVFHTGTVETILADTGWNVRRRATTPDSRLGGSHLLLIAAEAG